MEMVERGMEGGMGEREGRVGREGKKEKKDKVKGGKEKN